MVRPYTQTVSTRPADLLTRRPGAARPPLLPGGMPLRSAGGLRLTLRVKDCLDRALALSLAVAGLPVLLAGLLLVKLTSRGPAVYSQKRVGQFGRVLPR